MASPTNAEGIAAALSRPDAPSDVTQAFLEQNRDQQAVIAILFIGTFVTLILALRCYARVFIVKSFGLDDWLALLTMLPYISFIALCIVLIHLGSGRHIQYIQYVLDNPTTNTTEVLDFAAHILYTSALLICRLSGLAFYRRICNLHHQLILTIRCAAVFMIFAYLPQVFLIIFHCLPVTGYWPYGWQMPEVNNYKCLEWGTVYVTNSGLSLVCDMILFTIPIAIISMLRGSLSKKIKLSLVLLPGVLVIAISCTRIYLVVVGQWETDESWSYDPLLAVETAEIGATLFALSVPALKPFFSATSSLNSIAPSIPPVAVRPAPGPPPPVVVTSDSSGWMSTNEPHQKFPLRVFFPCTKATWAKSSRATPDCRRLMLIRI